MKKAESEGLITISWDIELRKLSDRVNEMYISDNVSLIADKWNARRVSVLKTAFQKSIIPSVQKHYQDTLEDQAAIYIVQQARNKFREV